MDTHTESLISTELEAEIAALRAKLAATETQYVSAMMDRNFLKRALADLNFHNNAHDGIVYTDSQRRVVYANPYFLNMMGIDTPDDLLGKPLPDYMWETPADESKLFADIQEYGFVRERELSLYDRSRQPIFVACSSVASHDETGNIIGTEIMLCNITSKRKVQAQLAQRTRELERITAFTRESLTHLMTITERGASAGELREILTDLQRRLESVNTP